MAEEIKHAESTVSFAKQPEVRHYSPVSAWTTQASSGPPVTYSDKDDSVKVTKEKSYEGMLRQASTTLFSIPKEFFMSRAEMRVWGEETLADPSVQPVPAEGSSALPYFPSHLPGYPPTSFKSFYQNVKYFRGSNCKTGPVLQTPTAFLHPDTAPSPLFQPMKLGSSCNKPLCPHSMFRNHFS